MTQANPNTPILPPYPRLGEIYRTLALALDTKSSNREIDRMAREGDFDWSLLLKLLEELFASPLAKYIDADFADLMMDHIRHFQTSYIGLLSTVSLDSLSREQALPLLISHFFTLQAGGVCHSIALDIGDSELLGKVLIEDAPIAAVLAYFESDSETNIAKIAYPSTTDADKTGRDQLARWRQDQQLPELSSIKLLTDALKQNGFEQTKLRHLPRYLLLARALCFLEKLSSLPLRKMIVYHLVHAGQDYDTGAALSAAVIAEGDKLSILKMPAFLLYEKLNRKTEKQAGEQAKVKCELEEFERLTSTHEPQGRTSYFIEWMKARFYILSGELTQALKHYEQASEAAFYRAGPQQKEIMQETLALAGKLGKKALLKRLKHRAIVFGLLPTPDPHELVETWEVEQFTQYYTVLFPLAVRFPEAVPDKEAPLSLLLIINPDEIAKLKPNLRQPNQVMTWKMQSGHVRRSPQLCLFASFGRNAEVQALLERSADVNQLDEANGSALLRALQRASDTRDRSTLDLLLAVPHSANTVNQATIKKELTPLQVAIEFGEPDVVERLLEMGAESELRYGVIEKNSPLYDCAGKFIFVTKPQWARDFYRSKMYGEPDAALKETLRRYTGGITGLFGEKPDHLLADPKNREVMDEIIRVMHGQRQENYTIAKLTRITELLLHHKAQPNARHNYPKPGRTALMVAAESDAAEAFELMLKAGGDPFQKDDAGYDCLHIAFRFKSQRVMDLMRKMGIC